MAKTKAKNISTINDLIPDPANVNKGTERGHYVIDWSLTELGAGRSILADADGVVIAGNKTLECAADHQLPVRVVQTDGKELVVVQRTDLRLSGAGKEREKARQLAIADNRASEVGYSADVEILLGHAQSGVDLSALYRESEIDALLAGLVTPKADNDEGKEQDKPEAEETPEEFQGVFALRESVIFPSTNRWGIPDLLPHRCSSQIPTEVYGRQEIEDSSKVLFIHQTAKFDATAKGGVLAFYVEDWRFESVWTDAVMFAEDALAFGWGSLVSPDFSVWRDDPAAAQLWNVYRSRWVARYWQEAGLQVIPSLNWSDERSYEFAHLGIPENLPLVSVQCRTTGSRLGREYFIKGLADAIERLRPQNVLIYGGADHQKWLADALPEAANYHFLESWTSMRRKRVFTKE